jgi:hypothetical protein
MLGSHEASYTLSAEILCHNPPGLTRWAWTSGVRPINDNLSSQVLLVQFLAQIFEIAFYLATVHRPSLKGQTRR